MDAHEFDGVIARGVAFIDTELTGLASRERQAIGLDLCQPHAGDALFLDWKRANGARRTYLAAIVAGGFATRPIRNDARCPKAFEAVFEAHRLKHIIRAGLKTFPATNARLEKLLLGQASGRPHRRRGAEARSCADCGQACAGEHSDEEAAA